MRKIILITVIALLIYLILAWFAGNLLGLHGSNLWILRAALWLIGFAAAGVVLWFFWSKQKEEEQATQTEAPAGGEEIGALLREAEKKLAAAHLAKSAKLSGLPAILLLGEASSTKTSVMLHSGLEPELLAGYVYQDGNVTPTRAANLWFSRRTVFVEAGAKLVENAPAWNHLIRRLQPRSAVVGGGGQAARAALVCVEIERITGDQQAMAATARNLRARLGEIAQVFGIQLPVYVLFTKVDRLAFFADFVRNLTNDEAMQVLGTTMRMMPADAGIYAEEQGARLGSAFDGIFRALAGARPEVLSRENEPVRLPGGYEFPREFRKLRAPLVQFLVDLCRPSQLTVGPYLRGFYFSAVRPVIVRETTAVAEVRGPEKQNTQSAKEATAMFRIPVGGQQTAAPAQQRTLGTRKVPQWVFLGHLFNDVLMADRAAMGASGSSARTSTLRRVLLASAAVICLVLAICFTVSFFENRGLEAQVNNALNGTAAAPAPGSLAAIEPLRRLEALRQALATLTVYNREGAPLRYRWGLYAGNEIYPDVRRLYFSRFKQLMFGQTQGSLVTFLNGLPAAPGNGTPPYDQTYDALKAYLITTSNHDKSTRDFLAPVLANTWSANQTVDADRAQLARMQFDFYSEELAIDNPFSKQNDTAAIAKARAYLKQFGDIDRIYQAMKAGAPKTSINFNGQFPGSKDYVVDAYDVAGPFTKEGWAFMSKAVRNPSQYVHGEKWVLGDEGGANVDPHELIKPLIDRYESDYIQQWRNYLKSASVVRFKDVKDAADKLNVLSGNQTPLLALFGLASQNTNVDDPAVVKAFQPVQGVVPPGSDRYTGPQNQDYMSALIKLQSSIDAVAKSPGGNDATAANQTLADATSAKVTTKQMAQKFNPDPEGRVDATTQKLLEDPITNTEALLRGLGPAELNAKGKEMCGKLNAVMRKYPFNPDGKVDATIAEFNGVFQKPDGALWAFYQQNLAKLLPKQGSTYVAAPGAAVTLSPAFVSFFNQAATFAESLYAGGSQDPHFSYTLKWMPSEGLQGADLQIDGQSLSDKPFVWQASGAHAAKAAYKQGGGSPLTFSDNDGLWSVFRFFAEADHRDRSGNGEVLEWVIRSGANRKPVTLANGKPLTVRFELTMAGGPDVFSKGYFQKLGCVADVAKPQ